MKHMCPHCKNRLSIAPHRMRFKGLFLLFDGVLCRHCGKRAPMQGMLQGMSLPYIDLLFKLAVMAYAVYLCVLGTPLFLPVAVFVVLLLNYGMYPLLIAAGILVGQKS